MRGGASGLGAVGLAAVCGRVELQARIGELIGLTEEVDAIESGLPRLAQRLAEYIARVVREAAGAQAPSALRASDTPAHHIGRDSRGRRT
jgi:hypothetical protein